jgi:apolipoprotein D and lipocalin family protein
MAATIDSLNDEIERAERRVYEADQRAIGSARALRTRWQEAAPKILMGAAAAIATTVIGVLVVRSRSAVAQRTIVPRRSLHAVAARSSTRESFNQLLHTARPLLRQISPRLIVTGSALIAKMLARPRTAEAPLTTAAHVDLERFAGTWNEIARLPDRHEKGCHSGITVTYAMTDDGLRVLNRCNRKDGSIRRSFGRAEIVPGTGNARLKVSYAPKILDLLPFVWSDLHIIHVADDYSSAVLGTPNRNHLWLIAREKRTSDEVRAAFLTKAQAQGFDTSKLIYCPHD